MAYMRYYRSLLNEKEKEAYDTLVEAIARRKESIRVKPLTNQELRRVHAAVDRDYPDFFYVNFYNTYSCSTSRYTDVQIQYTMDVYEAKRIKNEIDKKAIKIVDGARGLSELETEAYLNDEIRKMAVYADSQDNFNVQHLMGVFLDGKCVCEGYAKAFKYLADMLELKSIIVLGNGGLEGDTEPHAWNIVRIDGENYHLDVTFNSVERDKRTNKIIHFSRAYFNLSDKEICRDHTVDTMFKVPSCPKSRSEVAIISSTSQLMNHLRQESKKNKRFTEMRFTKHFDTIDEVSKMIEDNLTPLDYGWYRKIVTFFASYYSFTIEWQ